MALPKRFRGYAKQARAQGQLQYGSSQNLLAMLLGQAGTDLGRSIQQAEGGSRVLKAGISEARGSLDRNLAAAGLNPQQLEGTPDQRRIQQTYANTLNELDLRKVQADEYAASGVRQARDAYTEGAGKIKSQLVQLLSDRGVYESGLLEGLIGEDRTTRREARSEMREQNFEAGQDALDRATRLETAIIGQNIDPSTGRILNPRKNPKGDPKAKPKLTLNQQNSAIDAIAQARGAYDQFSGQAGFNPSGLRNGLRVGSLPTGDKPIKIPKVTSDIYVTAGFELAKNGRVSAETAKELRKRGLRIPGKWQPRSKRVKSRPGTAPGANGQQRPT